MKNYVNLLLSALVAVALVAWLSKYLDTGALWATLMSARMDWLALAILLLAVYQFLRGIRIRLFLPERRGPAVGMFGLMCAQGFLNNLLPSWLGDAALVYLLKRFHGMGLYSGAASVLVTRIADLMFIMVMFAILAGLTLSRASAPFLVIALALMAMIAVVVGAVALLLRYGASPKPEGRFAGRVHGWLERLGHAFQSIRAQEGLAAPLLMCTGCMWLVQYFVFVSLVRALGHGVPLFTMLGVYLIGFSENLLPIKGVASLGTYETAWFVALKIFGMDSSTATLLGFGSHALMFLIISVLAVPGFLILARDGWGNGE